MKLLRSVATGLMLVGSPGALVRLHSMKALYDSA